jgi:hypothetical protein
MRFLWKGDDSIADVCAHSVVARSQDSRTTAQLPIVVVISCDTMVRMSVVDELEREIAELATRVDVATHRLLTCFREFEES